MAVSNIRAELSAPVEAVWAIVTSFDGSWRSDLREIVKTDDTHFKEIAKNGFETRFTITSFKPCELYEFNIENDNITGRWTGRFSVENNKTVIDFTEDISLKKAFMKPFAKRFLKKQQETYLRDLRKALEK